MAYDLLKGLQPEVFFKWFGAVSEVPRGSRKEGQFIAFLEEFARARGLAYETDEAGNVLMRVPASPGYEAEPLLLLQAHMDMVWASEPGLNFDFEHSAIPMKIEDGLLRGKGTTLGADNGVGLAAMLAVADISEIPHPELECLFTVTEEIGLHGIRQFDCSKLRARRMINMDCGDSHVVAVSSAGSAKMAAVKPFAGIDAPEGMTALRIEVKGLTGGHSGLTIDRGSACAANAMGLLLEGISDCGALLLRIRSSERPILKSCLAEVLVPAKGLQKALACLEETAGKLKKRYAATDPGMEIEFLETAPPADAKALNEADSQAAVGALLLMKTGPYRFKESDRSVIIMSGSIGKVL
nr:M20/M25/M40 family metallo-hydrolase [Clostridia bacterium]